MYSGFILFGVLNTSRGRIYSCFTSIVDLPDLVEIDSQSLEKSLGGILRARSCIFSDFAEQKCHTRGQ